MTALKFSDLVEPVAVDQKTALRITVLGGGSFGTAMANLAVRNGCDTMIWIRDAAVAEEINQTQNLVFTFNKDLVPVSELNTWYSTDYIEFSPKVEGRFKWTAPNELVFSPAVGFDPALYQCRFTNG